MHRLSLALASCAMLAACGGDGSSGGTAAGPPTTSPTPSPGATPSPTPSPSVSLTTGEIKPVANATFIAATMDMTTTGGPSNTLTGQTPGGATSNRSVAGDTPSFAGSYSPTAGYQFGDAVNSADFGPAQLAFDTTYQASYPTVLFAKVDGLVEDYLALYKNVEMTISSLGSGTVTPKFAGNGGWQHTVVSSASRQTRLNYFAFGPETPVNAMPHSGVVKFTLMGSGNYAGDADLYFVSHSNTITVDFGAGTISGMITGSGTNFFVGGPGGNGGLFGVSLDGAITGNTVSGPTGSSIAVAKGQFRLLFVGPNAEELIVTYIGDDGRGTYVGSSVGVRNPYIP